MIKAKVSTNYKDIERIFAGGSIQKEILKIWSTKANAYVFEAWKILEMEGPLPITINSNGEDLIDYRIYGNTEQTGTPTPENPITPIGCGELETTGIHAGQYKLPILSNSTVTNIYLGETQSTRRIKKLVLTGEEKILLRAEFANATAYSYSHYTDDALPYNAAPIICSHFPFLASYIDQSDHIYQDTKNFYITSTQYRTVADFKSYLASQYAAGTPVTVWYVLAEPETGIVNEPLMKIGNYSDTIDSTQANVQIPTSKGTTVIDYDGVYHFITSDGYELVDKNQNSFLLSGSALRPSKMYIKYKGR